MSWRAGELVSWRVKNSEIAKGEKRNFIPCAVYRFKNLINFITL
jgi:hypothetical protein